MFAAFRVWDTANELGDVVIAQFSIESDAELFVRAKASKDGGYNGNLWVGRSYEDRRQLQPN